MNILSITPRAIILKNVYPISSFNSEKVYYKVEIDNTISDTKEKGWYIQNIVITYVRFNGKNMCGVTVLNSFAMKLGDGKVVPSSNDDFSIYADLTQIAISQTRCLFHIEFKETEFEKDFLPFERKEKILEKVKNSVYAVLN